MLKPKNDTQNNVDAVDSDVTLTNYCRSAQSCDTERDRQTGRQTDRETRDRQTDGRKRLRLGAIVTVLMACHWL